MTASSTTVDMSSFTTDAKFRTWGSAVSAALLASGLTNTADTGQINWTTVTKPVATTTKAGYEIWRFNDSLQSTKPIYFRLDYGSNGVASGNSPCTWLTVGTGTDGAGTITGPGMIVTQSVSSATSSSNATSVVGAAYSTSSGACTILAGLQYNGSPVHAGLWMISRTCNETTGVTDGNGVWVYNTSTPSAPATAGASYNPANVYASSSTVAAGMLKNASVSTGSVVQLYKNYALIPVPTPINGALSYYTSDISAMSTFTSSPWGTSHTYLALGATNSSLHNWLVTGSVVGAYIWE